MFKGIVDIGTDIERRSSKQVGSILIDKMTVAGN
jgi:PmbA protein